MSTKYTGVLISVLARLSGPPPMDSLSVQLGIRTFDPKSLGIRTCTDTEATRNLVLFFFGTIFHFVWIPGPVGICPWGPNIRTFVCTDTAVDLDIRSTDTGTPV
jgi:hypothetical protein